MLVTCPECGAKISDKANPCPKCGAPEAGEKSKEVKEQYIKENTERIRKKGDGLCPKCKTRFSCEVVEEVYYSGMMCIGIYCRTCKTKMLLTPFDCQLLGEYG